MKHPFRVIKRQVVYLNARYRRLTKNTTQLYTLFALPNFVLPNLVLLRKWLSAFDG